MVSVNNYPLKELEEPDNRQNYRYPQDFDGKSGNWITFSRIKYQRPNFLAPGNVVPSGAVISLPLPPQLVSNYNAEWSNTELGMASSALTAGVGGKVDAVINSYSGGSGLGSSIADAFSDTGSIGKIIKSYAVSGAIEGAASTDLFQRAGIFAGFARNPHRAFLFNAPTFRSFTFTYKLVGRNPNETKSINSIIKEFKAAMMPSFKENLENNIFNYPDMYQISFAHDTYLFKIGNCILRGVGVDYHGEGSPSYTGIDDTKAPHSIMLTLDFQETEILTREKIEDGGY